MKIIRSADLTVLKTWLVGGQIDGLGNQAEGFCDFSAKDNPDSYPKSLEETKNLIEFLITEFNNGPCGDETPFGYYGRNYRFKMPSAKNLNILAKSVWETISGENAEYLSR